LLCEPWTKNGRRKIGDSNNVKAWILRMAILTATATACSTHDIGNSAYRSAAAAPCKTLVEGRCKQSGMRNWKPTGAEGVLRLRAARHDGVFNQTWQKHFVPAD